MSAARHVTGQGRLLDRRKFLLATHTALVAVTGYSIGRSLYCDRPADMPSRTDIAASMPERETDNLSATNGIAEPTWDIYILLNGRSRNLIESFLNRFIPGGVANLDEFVIPELSLNPRLTFDSLADLIDYLSEDGTEEYYISWYNSDQSGPEIGLVAFTRDGGAIAGLRFSMESVASEVLRVIPPVVVNTLREMGEFTASKFGCVLKEEPPPDTVEEFVEICQVSAPPKIVDGVFVGG
jgi:hypothetical protein